ETLGDIKLTPSQAKKSLQLKIEFKGATYAFYYSIDSGKWNLIKDNVDGKYLSTHIAEGFVGSTIGMYTSSNGKPSTNKASFDWFHYTGNDPVYNDQEFMKTQGVK